MTEKKAQAQGAEWFRKFRGETPEQAAKKEEERKKKRRQQYLTEIKKLRQHVQTLQNNFKVQEEKVKKDIFG